MTIGSKEDNFDKSQLVLKAIRAHKSQFLTGWKL